MQNKLSLPENRRVKGLYLTCTAKGCKKIYSNDSLVLCNCNRLVYQARISVPGKEGKVKCKNLTAKTVDKAIEQLYVFKNQL